MEESLQFLGAILEDSHYFNHPFFSLEMASDSQWRRNVLYFTLNVKDKTLDSLSPRSLEMTDIKQESKRNVQILLRPKYSKNEYCRIHETKFRVELTERKQ